MIRLLCVEDDPILRDYLDRRLAGEPDLHVVGLVPDVRGALTYLSHEEIDLLVLDQQLEGASGLRLLEMMSEWYGWPAATESRPAVLFCTGFADEEFTAKARAMGAGGVVAKSRIRHDLLPAVRTVAAGGSWPVSEFLFPGIS